MNCKLRHDLNYFSQGALFVGGAPGVQVGGAATGGAGAAGGHAGGAAAGTAAVGGAHAAAGGAAAVGGAHAGGAAATGTAATGGGAGAPAGALPGTLPSRSFTPNTLEYCGLSFCGPMVAMKGMLCNCLVSLMSVTLTT